ncbi:Cytochrome c2 precursor [Aquimixticola soesokkakensis]|uniref:Cytochrome c2 n=1 Tax=Aquimixticola soesokkakensis TaxID=1519096 RepID=A0A1Y5SCS5_9RHOB|nr:cytochrome C [Aquimixticola soesokkakensis]SLN34978.1 Cytochrome c2 precursor [Aquimixticola soesokkakensis]
MRVLIAAITASATLCATAAFAEGDADKGAKDYNRCKACHAIEGPDGFIVKGGKTGPNLYGIVGRTAGSLDGYAYKPSIVAAGEAGLVWTPELIAQYVVDTSGFLEDYLDDPKAKSGMSKQALREPSNVAAFLALHGAKADATAEGTGEGADENTGEGAGDITVENSGEDSAQTP